MENLTTNTTEVSEVIKEQTRQTMREFMENRLLDKYVVVRTENAGVFFGLLKIYENRSAVVEDARRIWRWVGAASLSQLAKDGVTSPEECKFPCPVDFVVLEEVIEVLPLTADAHDSLNSVPEWKAE